MKKNPPIAGEIVSCDTSKGVVLPCLIGFLIPGAGHLYIKDRKRGMLIFVLLFITFFSCVFMHGKIYTPSFEGTRWDKMISLLASTAELGNGLYYITSLFFADVSGDLPSVYYEVGTVYGITSGLLNFLVLFSLYDLITKKKIETGKDNTPPKMDIPGL